MGTDYWQTIKRKCGFKEGTEDKTMGENLMYSVHLNCYKQNYSCRLRLFAKQNIGHLKVCTTQSRFNKGSQFFKPVNERSCLYI